MLLTKRFHKAPVEFQSFSAHGEDGFRPTVPLKIQKINSNTRHHRRPRHGPLRQTANKTQRENLKPEQVCLVFS